MPKPKIPNSRKAALEHRKRIERYTALINQLYDRLNKEAAKIALSTGHDPAAQFLWSDYPETRKALKDLQEQYVSEMTGIVMAGTSAEWKESDLVQDLVAQKLLKAYTGTTKAGDEYARYFQTDPDALKAFQQRKAGGMNLSQRVWNLSEQYKTELEMALSAAIEPGTSAMELAADIKTYLNEPDKMFRRFRYKDEDENWQRKWKQKVTDADGKVHFVDADPKAYHPGRGVYRSSARNAQRLARTEINMAYRAAEQERWKSFDFVVGYEVKITQNGKHVEDICDCLKGKYRKDFKFMGWHPQCMCYTIPILKTEDEFFNDDEDAKSVNEVEDVPQGFKDWIKDNEERIERAEKRGTLPYFIRDNRGEVDRILHPDKEAENTAKSQIAESAKATAVNPKPKPKEPTAQEKNHQELAKALGVEQGEPMSFEEANEMRGNPNYKKGVKYRVNCQCSVLANEMRRRGFDVEAYGNTKQDWYMPSVLAKKPEIAFLDANGNPPAAIGITFNGDLLTSLQGEMKEPGRYHLRFRFQNDSGHVITAERLADGSLRIYDPQSGKIIKNFSEYTSKVKGESFEYYRVDNLQINPNVAKGSVKLAKSKGDAPRMQLPEIKDFLEKGWYGEEDFYSPKVKSVLRSLRDKKSKEDYFDSLLSNDEFAIEHTDENGRKTVLHPKHKIKDAYWPKTKQMAYALNRAGRDVVFLPEHDNEIMADALTKFKDIPRIVDFKYSASTKFNTLQQHLAEGFNQAGAVVLKLEKMDAGQFRDTIEYMKRNDLPLGDVILINKYNQIKEIGIGSLFSGSYKQKIKGFLK